MYVLWLSNFTPGHIARAHIGPPRWMVITNLWWQSSGGTLGAHHRERRQVKCGQGIQGCHADARSKDLCVCSNMEEFLNDPLMKKVENEWKLISLQWVKNTWARNNKHFKRTYPNKKTTLKRLPIKGGLCKCRRGIEGLKQFVKTSRYSKNALRFCHGARLWKMGSSPCCDLSDLTWINYWNLLCLVSSLVKCGVRTGQGEATCSERAVWPISTSTDSEAWYDWSRQVWGTAERCRLWHIGKMSPYRDQLPLSSSFSATG